MTYQSHPRRAHTHRERQPAARVRGAVLSRAADDRVCAGGAGQGAGGDQHVGGELVLGDGAAPRQLRERVRAGHRRFFLLYLPSSRIMRVYVLLAL